MRPASPGSGTGLARGCQRLPEQASVEPLAAFCTLPPCAFPTRRVAGLGLHRQRGCAHLRIPAAVHSAALPEQPHVLATRGPGHSEPIRPGSCCLHIHHVLFHGMRWCLGLLPVLIHVVGEVLHFPCVLRWFGDVHIFTIGGCLQFTVFYSSASPPFPVMACICMVSFVRHIGINELACL